MSGQSEMLRKAMDVLGSIFDGETLSLANRNKARDIIYEWDTLPQAAELPDDRAQREEVEDDCAGAIAALQERVDQLEGERGGSLDREFLGQLVRSAWIEWAKAQPNPGSNWLVEWDELDESMKEADRVIGEKVASVLISPFTLIAEHETEKVEKLLLLMTGRFLEQTDLVGPGDLCQECKQAHRCGPDKDEPCDDFNEARERFTDLAPVRAHLDDLMKGGRRWPKQDDLEVRVAVCLWCGYQETYHPGTPKEEVRARMRAHDKVCPKSPVLARALEAEKELARVTGPQLDWDAALVHFCQVRGLYRSLPPESGAPALRVTFRPLLARYEAGERSQLLFDGMMAVE